MTGKRKLSKTLRAWPLCSALALCGTLLCGAGNGERWWRHVANLGFGNEQARPAPAGERRRPAEYVAAQLKKAGVLPAANGGYMQPVKIRSRRIMEQYSSLSLRGGGAERPLDLGADVIVDMNFDPAPATQAQLVFVGYGLHIPEAGYDDLAGLDVRGKIAVMVSGGRSDIPPSLLAHYQSIEERNKALRRRAGVYGIVTIRNPNGDETPWTRLAESRLQTALSLADPAFEQDDDLELAVIANPDRAERFFEGSGHTVRELLAAANAGKPLPHFPLTVSLRAQISIERQQSESQNIVGVLPGSDPALKNEFVVLSGRLDDHGGADASMAAASLLDIADALHDSGVKLRRSLLFLFLTAEDQGLLGSQFFSRYPTVDFPSIVADLDLGAADAGRPRQGALVSAGSESELGVFIHAAARRSGVRLEEGEGSQRNWLTEGSHYSFLLHGTPSAGLRAWIADARSDRRDVSRIDDMALEVAMTLANRPEKPHWLTASFFGKVSR